MALSQDRMYSKRSRSASRQQSKLKARATQPKRQPAQARAGNGPAWASKDWQARARTRNQAQIPQNPAAYAYSQRSQGAEAAFRGAGTPRLPSVPGYSAGMPLWQQALLGTMPQMGNMGGGMTMGMQAPRGQRARLPGQTPTTMPDAYNAVPRQPWWATPEGQARTGQPMTSRTWAERAISKNYMAGSIAKPTRVSAVPEGYADYSDLSAAAPDAGGGGDWWNDYGSSGYGGYSYPDYGGGSFGGSAYAQPMQKGYNPQNAQTPRWWHNRLSWRF